MCQSCNCHLRGKLTAHCTLQIGGPAHTLDHSPPNYCCLISSQLKVDLNDDNTILNFLCHLDKENYNFHWRQACNVCQWVVQPDGCNAMVDGRRTATASCDDRWNIHFKLRFNTHQRNYRLNVSDLWTVYDTKKRLCTIKSIQMFALEN